MSLTKQERLVLLFLLGVVLFGGAVRLAFHFFPQARSWMLFLDERSRLRRVDLNCASAQELMMSLGISEKLAQSIVSCRREQGRFSSVEEVLSIPGVGPKTFSRIKIFLYVRGEKQ